MTAGSPSRVVRGFTLVEMLVVIVLLSLIMLAIVSSLRSVAQGSERASAHFERLDDKRITGNFLRGALARVSARRVTSPERSGPLFEGAPDHVAWVGVMPARYGAGGRMFFRLAIEPQEQGSALVLRYLPWFDQPRFPDWQQAAVQVLVPGAQGLALRYRDARQPDESLAWSESWSPVDDLPAALALVVTGEAGKLLQTMEFPVWSLPHSDPRQSGDVTSSGGG
jgi:general secretion pathway protein J